MAVREDRIRSQVAWDPDRAEKYLTHVMPSASSFQLKAFTCLSANLFALVISMLPAKSQVLKVSNEGHP